MSHLKRYGMYFVFAGMSVTGVYVWDNLSKVPQAESYAEAVNGVAERYVVGNLLGGASPDWALFNYGATNLFPSALLTKKLVDDLAYWSSAAFGIPVGDYVSSGTNKTFAGGQWVSDILWLMTTNNLYDGSASFVTNTSGFVSSETTYRPNYGLGFTPGWPVTVWDAALASEVRDGDWCSTSILRTGGAGDFNFRSGTPVTNQPMPQLVYVHLSQFIDTNLGFSVTVPAGGCLWSTNYGQYAFVQSRIDTPLDRVFRKRDITTPVGVCSGLVTSVRALHMPDTFVTNRVSPNVLKGSVGYYEAPDSYLSECEASATNATSVVWTGSPEWMYSFRYSAENSVTSSNGTAVAWANDFAFNKELKYPLGFVGGMEYPSHYAITNGYVSRIRVFGIFGYDITQESALPTMDVGDTNGVSVVDGVYALSLSDIPGLSFSHTVSSPDLSGVASSSSAGDLHTPPDTFERSSLRIALLYEAVNPTSTSAVSWASVQVPVMTFPSAPGSYQAKYGYTGSRSTEESFVETFDDLFRHYGWTVTVTLNDVFVVVDWNWRHLNKENPYVAPE